MSLLLSKNAAKDKMEALNNAQALIEFDTRGKILDANENFLKVMGYSLNEVVGKHHSMFIRQEETGSEAYKAFWRKLAAGEQQTAEFLRLGKGGKEVWLQASYMPVRKNGRVLSVMKAASDTSEIKAKTADAEGQLRAINASQAVIEFDMGGKILKANPNFCKAMGYDESEILGRHHSMFVDKKDQGNEYQRFWQSLREGKFQSAEYLRIGKNGRHVYIQASYNPIFDSAGRPWKVVKFATDVTAQVEDRLRRQTVSEQVDHDLDEILTAVANVVQIFEGSASASRETAQNVENVAAGSSQLADSVREISTQVQKAGEISSNAVVRSRAAAEFMGRLSSSADQITNVVKLISDIAEQTNLLALNATIEAARAGEAGKGFAVVASEVKALANQSARATEEISSQIQDVQSATSGAISAIDLVEKVIEEVNSISVAISGAVEEQSAVTRDISENMGAASQAVGNISQDVESVAGTMAQIRGNAEKLKDLTASIAV